MSIRSRLFQTSLEYVVTHGWNRKSIAAAAVSLGYPSSVTALFPREGIDLLDAYSQSINHQLEEKFNTAPSINFYSSINAVLKERINLLKPEIEIWKSALEEMSKAQNLKFGISNLTATSDFICRISGDTSFDFQYYQRRAKIAAVIASTDLYFINDISPDKSFTEKFLLRQIVRASAVEDSVNHLEQISKMLYFSAVQIL